MRRLLAQPCPARRDPKRECAATGDRNGERHWPHTRCRSAYRPRHPRSHRRIAARSQSGLMPSRRRWERASAPPRRSATATARARPDRTPSHQSGSAQEKIRSQRSAYRWRRPHTRVRRARPCDQAQAATPIGSRACCPGRSRGMMWRRPAQRRTARSRTPTAARTASRQSTQTNHHRRDSRPPCWR